MALITSGTQSASISTEHSLATVTDDKAIQGGVDLSNMVADDEVEIRVYMKFISGGTKRQVFLGTYKHDQGDVGAITPPTFSPFYWEITLKQVAGTGRSFDWFVSGT